MSTFEDKESNHSQVNYEEEEMNSQNESQQSKVKNKYEVAEIEFIQQEIQAITKKIEQEKIKKRIAEERYEKKAAEYNKLQGKPVEMSKEEKEKQRKEKREKSKEKRKDEPKKRSKNVMYNETVEKKRKEITKQEAEVDSLTKEINKYNLQNKELKEEIQNLRKQKGTVTQQLESVNQRNKQLEKDIKTLNEKNEKEQERIQNEEYTNLKETEKESAILHQTFYAERDRLEGKYHHIIEENIKRERDRKKEQARKRQMQGMIARTVMMNSKIKTPASVALEEQVKMLQNEDISDRTPALFVLVDKWIHVNKYKKQMIDKYLKNAQNIRDAFDRILKYLSLDDYEELPIIYQKSEEQLASIEMYIAQLENKYNEKEERKKILQEQIEFLKVKLNDNTEQKFNFNEVKHANILRLKENIDEVQKDIDNKLAYFRQIQPETDKFLIKLEETYLSDYVPNKIVLNDIRYNEDNIQIVFDNVQNFCKLISEFEKFTGERRKDNDNEIDKLREDIKYKLENFKKENCMTTPNFLRAKNEMKANAVGFDDTIRKLADVIVEQVSSTNMGMGAQGKNKKKKK